MALIVGHNGSSKSELVANRTEQSGGSQGGVKKSGIWGGNIYMRVMNVGTKYAYRTPQTALSAVKFKMTTTRNPTQLKRNSAYATHSGTLG